MLPPQAVIDGERPGLDVGEDAMDPRQDDVSGHVADDVRFMHYLRRAGIAGPAVGFGGGALGDVGLDEGMQAIGRVVDRPAARGSTAPATSILPSSLCPSPLLRIQFANRHGAS